VKITSLPVRNAKEELRSYRPAGLIPGTLYPGVERMVVIMEFSVTWALVSAGAWIKTAMNAGARWYEDYLTAQ